MTRRATLPLVMRSAVMVVDVEEGVELGSEFADRRGGRPGAEPGLHGLRSPASSAVTRGWRSRCGAPEVSEVSSPTT